MPHPKALFIDLRRAKVDSWPEDHAFTIAYIVTDTIDTTQDFFKAHHQHLKQIPQITVEITDPQTLHLVTRLPVVTRLSLPQDLITAGLSDHFELDAIITWDNRRTIDFYKNPITAALSKGANHLSIYGLQDFTRWQDIQTFLNGQGLHFYERFHAALPGHESPYQNHLAAFGDVIAYGGWSRLTENNVTRVKSPRALHWHPLDKKEQHEEKLLLGLASRQGLPLSLMTTKPAAVALQNGLALSKDNHLVPTDTGLWNTTRLVGHLTE
jgi:hypothetical protein